MLRMRHKIDRRQRGLCLFLLLLLVGGPLALSACSSPAQITPTSAPMASGAPTELPTTSAPHPTIVYAETRPAAVAGAFYPDDPVQVVSVLDQFLAPVTPLDGTPIALIVPHAGWVYSGQVAAFAYKQIEAARYDTVVIIGPNHTDPTFDDISVYAQGAFETPTGPVPVDEALAAELLAANERIVFDRDVHQQEHSIEVQLPFLQRVCPDCSIVPILIGQPTKDNVDILTDALTEILPGKHALIVASSDLSHYPNYTDAVQVDTRTLVALETFDPETVSGVMTGQMTQGIPGLVTCACGEGPILVAMRVAEALGADHVRILRYANSGDVSGDTSRVVGYGAVMFWHWQPPDLSAALESELLVIARESIKGFIANGEVPALDPPADPLLSRRLGAFVTLTRDGELRGCIGHMYGDAPLYQTVAQAAADAAVNDPRFPPLTADQLDQVEIEVSVLSPFTRVRDVHDEGQIQVGRHGLYLLYGEQRGVLLPQVPVNEGWDRAEFLQQICFKAGLPADCWERATLYTFSALVFGEDRVH